MCLLTSMDNEYIRCQCRRPGCDQLKIWQTVGHRTACQWYLTRTQYKGAVEDLLVHEMYQSLQKRCKDEKERPCLVKNNVIVDAAPGTWVSDRCSQWLRTAAMLSHRREEEAYPLTVEEKLRAMHNGSYTQGVVDGWKEDPDEMAFTLPTVQPGEEAGLIHRLVEPHRCQESKDGCGICWHRMGVEFGPAALNKHGYKPLKKYGLGPLEKYGLDALEQYGLKAVETYGLRALQTYGLDRLRKYGKEALDRAASSGSQRAPAPRRNSASQRSFVPPSYQGPSRTGSSTAGPKLIYRPGRTW